MRAGLLSILLVVGIAACRDQHPTGVPDGTTDGAGRASMRRGVVGEPAPVVFFGPERFVRGKGTPIAETRQFTLAGFVGPFTIRLRNGDATGTGRVSSASVELNGQTLFGPANFSQQVTALTRQVPLGKTNTLRVTLQGSPGGLVDVSIEGTPTPLEPVVLIPDADHSSSATISSSGGTISAVGADGTVYTLIVPSGAVSTATRISIAPLKRLIGLPTGARLLGGVEGSPTGLNFLRPATLVVQPKNGLGSGVVRGISYSTASSGIIPAAINGGEIRLGVSHWSGVAVASGVEGACAAGPPPAASVVEEYEHALGCARDIADYVLVVREWLNASLLPELRSAGSYAAFAPAISSYWHWLAAALRHQDYQNAIFDWFPGIDQDIETASLAAVDAIARTTQAVNSVCVCALTEADKTTRLNELLFVQSATDNIPRGWADPVVATQGALCSVSLSVDATVAQPSLHVGQSSTGRFEIRGHVWGPLDKEYAVGPGGDLACASLGWQVSKPQVLAVSSTGQVTASVTGLHAGIASVSPTLPGLLSDRLSAGAHAKSIDITVEGVAELAIQPPAVTLSVGAQSPLVVTAKDEHGEPVTNPQIVWTNSRPDVVALDGLVLTGRTGGTSTISATVDGVTATVPVTVLGVAQLSIQPTSISLTVGAQRTLTVTAKDKNGVTIPNPPIVWTIGDRNLVSMVDLTVKGLAAGETAVSASVDGITVIVPVTVTSIVELTVQPTSVTLAVGVQRTLTVTAKDQSGATVANPQVSWTNSRPDIVAIDGLVLTGRAVGSAVISASAGGITVVVSVTVIAATQVLISVMNPLDVGREYPASACIWVMYQTCSWSSTAFTWLSSNASVATVDSRGSVKGVSAGTARISATSASGMTGYVDLIVPEPNNMIRGTVWHDEGGGVLTPEDARESGVRMQLYKDYYGSAFPWISQANEQGEFAFPVRDGTYVLFCGGCASLSSGARMVTISVAQGQIVTRDFVANFAGERTPPDGWLRLVSCVGDCESSTVNVTNESATVEFEVNAYDTGSGVVYSEVKAYYGVYPNRQYTGQCVAYDGTARLITTARCSLTIPKGTRLGMPSSEDGGQWTITSEFRDRMGNLGGSSSMSLYLRSCREARPGLLQAWWCD